MRYPTDNEQRYLKNLYGFQKRAFKCALSALVLLFIASTAGGLWLIGKMASHEVGVGIFGIVFVDGFLLLIIWMIARFLMQDFPRNTTVAVTGEYRVELRGRFRTRRAVHLIGDYCIAHLPEPWWEEYVEEGAVVTAELYPLHSPVEGFPGGQEGKPYAVLRIGDEYAIDREVEKNRFRFCGFS